MGTWIRPKRLASTVMFATWSLCCACGSTPTDSSDPPSRSLTPQPMSLPAQVSAGQAAAVPVSPPPASPPTLLMPAQPVAMQSAAGHAGPEVCSASSAAAEKLPVDVFIMLDQSLSMVGLDDAGVTRWDNVISALTQFVQAPESAGLSIGLQYFGLGVSCEPADYAVPEVEIAALPGNAQAIVSSFAMHGPSALTPTAPALQGAIMHAQTYRMQHPGHEVAVLLVTDGEPDACGLDPEGETAAAAAAGLRGNPAVKTYVLGVGTMLDALNQFAAAGGTGHAYIIDGSQNVSTQIVAALNEIRGTASLPCEFAIPAPEPGMPFDFDMVNLTFTSPEGQDMPIGYAADPATCNSAPLAWRYDDRNAPTKIILCDTTCATAANGGKIALALHCPTVSLD